MRAKLAATPEDTRLEFVCPGCKFRHAPRVDGTAPWTWNGNLERPTLSPSVLVTWDEYENGGNPPTPKRCHSFVRDGRIEFLSDCTHALAGQTVELPELTY